MALKLMYITKLPEVARIAENAGVDRIFVDMEYIGKEKRQHGMNTVKNHHTIQDVKNIRQVITKSELLVRINKIYPGSEAEINGVIDAGADIIMLPYFKTIEEVRFFVDCVDNRCKKMLLLETPEAVDLLDEILKIDGIDEIHIGINDLSMGYDKKFMFEVLEDGTVDKICEKIKGHCPYGFGGIASLGNGLLKSERVIEEQYRLGSSMAILSRSFCDIEKIDDINEVERVFNTETHKIRDFEAYCAEHSEDYENNRIETNKIIRRIAEQ